MAGRCSARTRRAFSHILEPPQEPMKRSRVVLCAIFVIAMRAGAQAVDSTASISGRVRSAVDAIPLLLADVSLDATNTWSHVGEDGRFEFRGLTPGPHTLRARAIGYEPMSFSLSLTPGGTIVQEISLPRAVQVLREVVIEGRTLKYPARFQSVYGRAAKSNGRFITAEDIALQNPLDTKALFQAIPGVLVSDRGITFARCQGGLQGPQVLTAAGNTASVTVSKQVAKVQVWVDGHRMTREFSRGDEITADNVLREVNPRYIQAIEVYVGTARIPGEFLDDACAVIAIWTKSYGG